MMPIGDGGDDDDGGDRRQFHEHEAGTEALIVGHVVAAIFPPLYCHSYLTPYFRLLTT